MKGEVVHRLQLLLGYEPSVSRRGTHHGLYYELFEHSVGTREWGRACLGKTEKTHGSVPAGLGLGIASQSGRKDALRTGLVGGQLVEHHLEGNLARRVGDARVRAGLARVHPEDEPRAAFPQKARRLGGREASCQRSGGRWGRWPTNKRDAMTTCVQHHRAAP